jgi:hypothetical protein
MSVRGFKATASYSYGKLEAAARRIRQRLMPGIADDAPMGGVEVFESLGNHAVAVAGRRVRLTYGIKALPGRVEGWTRFDDETGTIAVELAESTYDLLERGKGRGRQTFYHEVVHAFLHTRLVVRMSLIPHEAMEAMALERAATPHPIYFDTEWQADSGGAAILVPARGLLALERKHTLTTALVQSRFGVSWELARIRLSVFAKYRETLL